MDSQQRKLHVVQPLPQLAGGTCRFLLHIHYTAWGCCSHLHPHLWCQGGLLRRLGRGLLGHSQISPLEKVTGPQVWAGAFPTRNTTLVILAQTVETIVSTLLIFHCPLTVGSSALAGWIFSGSTGAFLVLGRATFDSTFFVALVACCKLITLTIISWLERLFALHAKRCLRVSRHLLFAGRAPRLQHFRFHPTRPLVLA